MTSALGSSGLAERNLNRFTVVLALDVVRLDRRARPHHEVPGDLMATGGNAIRGTRVGAGPMGEQDHGFHADRVAISYWDALGNETVRYFAAGIPEEEIPDTIDSPHSGPSRRARQGEPARAREDRAVQDAPRLREGASHRGRGRGPPRRRAPAAARAARRGLTAHVRSERPRTARPFAVQRAGSVLPVDELRRHLRRRGLVDEEDRALAALGAGRRHARVAGAGEREAERRRPCRRRRAPSRRAASS